MRDQARLAPVPLSATRRPSGHGARRALRCAGAGVLLAWLASTWSPLPGPAAQADAGRPESKASPGRVTVEVDGFRNDQGAALYALFRTQAGFPEAPLQAERRIPEKVVGGRSRAVFSDVAPGDFALSVLHDEDGDRKLKTGIFGIPREGVGFSRDARGRMGPPKFQDARLNLEPGGNMTVTIHMHYY